MRTSSTASLLVAALVMLRHPCSRNQATAQLLLERAAEHIELTPAEREACLDLADDLDRERPGPRCVAHEASHLTAPRFRPGPGTSFQPGARAAARPRYERIHRMKTAAHADESMKTAGAPMLTIAYRFPVLPRHHDPFRHAYRSACDGLRQTPGLVTHAFNAPRNRRDAFPREAFAASIATDASEAAFAPRPGKRAA